MSVRVRFAPSPTGYLHVGGLRTALYNYFFARKHGGSMILRIEDTDRTRFVENATENLIASLEWAGITFDEGPISGGNYGPYIQSERLDIYKKHAQMLIDNGNAYYAFDTADELDKMRLMQQEKNLPFQYDRASMRNQFTLGDAETKKLIASGADHVVRMKVIHEGNVLFEDIIRGEVSVPAKDIDDQVLLKSDGYPTYHLANVVDDHLMKITHVIRGEEWLPSTPKHILLYKFFGWECPSFAHLPLLLNKDKSKLSKRQGSVAVEDFRAKGYLRDAFVNFIALLGWNPTGDREIYAAEELIEFFKLDKVNKGGAVFDLQKLDWMNAQYIKSAPVEQLTEIFMADLRNRGINIDDEYARKLVNLFRERITFVQDIPDIAPYMFALPASYDEEYMNKRWKENSSELVKELILRFEATDDFSHNTLHDITKLFCEEKGIKLGEIIHPLRLMITGQSTGAGMFETMEVLGRDECLKRFNLFLEKHKK